MRDELIEMLRNNATEAIQSNLEQANVALSLLVGLEYPLGGLDRQMLDQARTALRSVSSE
jgi:hypothetical protein